MKLILLIEDNSGIRENTTELLELEGYRVMEALNGRHALELLEESIPNLILCDIAMPEMNGYELLKRLQESDRHRSVPFIFITASAEKREVEEGLKMGASGYIIKPYEADDLFALIRTHLDN